MRAVLERDFLFEASRTRAVVLRTVIAAVVGAVACFTFWVGTVENHVSPDQIGTFVFAAGGVALLLLLALLTPPLVVGSILEERQNDTLLLVLCTPIGPRSFAAAKLLSRWGVSLLIAFAALPALGMGILFGGVSGTQFTGLVVTALALSLEMAAWSVWISSGSRRLATAVILSFVLPLARWVGTGFLMAWLEDSARFRGGTVGRLSMAALADSSPIGPVVAMVERGAMAMMVGTGPSSPSFIERILFEQPWWFYLACSILWAGVTVAAAGARLRNEAEPKDSLLGRTKVGRRWFRGRPPAGNPMVWKEMKLLNTASSRPLFYGVLGVLLLVLVLGIDLVQRERTISGILAAMLTLVALVGTVQGAAAIGQERTQGGYDLLRASLLTPGQIVWGKLAGIFTGMGFLATVPLASGLLGLVTGSVEVPGLLGILLTTVLVPGAWAVVGLWIGVRAQSPRAAVVRAVALFAVFLVGLPVIAGILDILNIVEDDVAGFLALGSPPGTAWVFMESFKSNRWFIPENGWLWAVGWAALAGIVVLLLPRILARRMDEDRGPGPGSD